jgi:integrator complex subunit 11
MLISILSISQIEHDKTSKIEVKCQIKSLSFSAHADAKGIMQLIQQCQPKNVMLVHGEASKMKFLKKRIEAEFGIPCFDPANGEVLTIPNVPPVGVKISKQLLKNQSVELGPRDVEGVLVTDASDGSAMIVDADEVPEMLGAPRHFITFSVSRVVSNNHSPLSVLKRLATYVMIAEVSFTVIFFF